ncbi:MAG: pyridoxal phosphate-dependent aminotransferase, partial [Limosilactobacillus fermentum]
MGTKRPGVFPGAFCFPVFRKEVLPMPKMNPALRGRFNHDLTSIAPSNIRTFDAEVSSIKGIVKLTLGEPDF